jgi:hypothetical protein
MMRSAAIYGGLLVVLSGAAWVKWTAAPAVELDGKVVMVDGSPDELTRVVWLEKDKDQAVIVRKTDGLGVYYEVEQTRWTAPKPEKKPPAPAEDGAAAPDGATPDGATPDGAAPADGANPGDGDPPAEAPALEASVQHFKAGEKADELMASLAPILALRKLSELSPEQLETTGLDAAVESLELDRNGRVVRIQLGGEVYGTRDRYARIEGSPDVWLVDDELIKPLKYARTRLPDRELWSFEAKAIARATVSGGTGSVELLQKNAADPAQAAWVRAATPDAVDEQVKTWMEKALALKSVSYAEPTDDLSELQPVFSIRFEDEKGQSQTLEVLQKPWSGEGPKPDFWARSEHTRGTVKLLRGPTTALAEDVGALTGP